MTCNHSEQKYTYICIFDLDTRHYLGYNNTAYKSHMKLIQFKQNARYKCQTLNGSHIKTVHTQYNSSSNS